LRVEQERMRRYMVSRFSELRSALGVTYEMHAAAYIELLLEELRQKYKVKRIGVFGSFVRGEQKKKSDIDLLVEF